MPPPPQGLKNLERQRCSSLVESFAQQPSFCPSCSRLLLSLSQTRTLLVRSPLLNLLLPLLTVTIEKPLDAYSPDLKNELYYKKYLIFPANGSRLVLKKKKDVQFLRNPPHHTADLDDVELTLHPCRMMWKRPRPALYSPTSLFLARWAKTSRRSTHSTNSYLVSCPPFHYSN